MSPNRFQSWSFVVSVLVGLSISLSSSSLFADDCRDILEQGIRNTYTSLKTNNFSSSFKEGFCSNSLQAVKNSSGGGLSIGFPVDGVPVDIGGNYNESSANSLKQDACKNGSGNVSDDKYELLLTSIADPSIVSAWAQCKNNDGGVLLTGKLNGSTLILSIRFRNVGNIYETVFEGDASFDGINCPNNWINGTKLNGSTKYMQCKRIGEDPITVTVNTSFNGAMFYIPVPKKLIIEPQPKPVASPGPISAPQPATAKVCIQPSNQNNRCPAANPLADNGSQCSCQLPVALTPFNDGVVQTIQIYGVLRAPQ